MKRRTLLKLLSLLPFAGPIITKALPKSDCKLAQVYAPYLPTDFPKWNQAVDGLEDAGKWALEIERSRLPQDLVFPREGQIWEAVRDCETRFRPFFSSPRPQPWPQPYAAGLPKEVGPLMAAPNHDLLVRSLLGGKAQLRQGERIRILGIADTKPLFVTFQPVRYDELHQCIVPEDMRGLPGYFGYELSLKTAKTVADFGKDACQTFFNEAFRLVEDARPG